MLEFDEAAEQQRQLHAENMRAASEAASRELHEAVTKEVANTEVRLRQEYDAMLQAEREATGQRVADMHSDVAALDAVLTHDSTYKRTSHATHQLSAAVLAIEESLTRRSSVPARTALQVLPKLASKLNHQVLIEAVRPLTDKGSAEKLAKAPTISQLQNRLHDVAAAGRTAALVPSGSGMWGHALAGVISAITFKGAEVAGSDAARIFDCAERAMTQGTLLEAVTEIRKLEGPPAAACRGWLDAAQERLLLDQMLTVVKAESSIAMAALT